MPWIARGDTVACEEEAQVVDEIVDPDIMMGNLITGYA